MSWEYRSTDWNSYLMDYANPHQELEPLEKEVTVVAEALSSLEQAGILPHTRYDGGKMLAHRKAVAEHFEIPWTAITPRMERLLYAINAIMQPQNMIAAGIFCGVTFVSNAGAAIGPGACYTAENLIGVEILEGEARRAERNVRRIDPEGTARIVSENAVDTVANFKEPIHLLYLDADDGTEKGETIYLEIVKACYDKLPEGGLVLAHNSENYADRIASYLAFARDPGNFRESVNVVFDIEGLEVSIR